MPVAVRAEGISKRYRLGAGVSGLRSALAGLWRRNEPDEFHWAVKGVSFELQPGDALGIIGPNGSGKTTILKILSRVTRPTTGTVKVDGRLSALVELGAGFHPDLTGRENVFLNGAILGMKKAEIAERFDRIVEFAGVGKFLDTPVKRYSSGMYARLGFATAAHVDPDVLLVDEVLAVGDYAFQMKCYARMDELRAKGASLIFVSHNFDAIRRVCSRALVMYRGEALFQGTPHAAVAAYSEAIREAAKRSPAAAPAEQGLSERIMTCDAEVKGVRLMDAESRPTSVLRSGSTARLVMDVDFHRDVGQPIFGFSVYGQDGRKVYVTTSRWLGIPTGSFSAGDRCRVEFRWNVALLDGTYDLGVDVTADALTHYHDRLEQALAFSVVGSKGAEGLAALDATMVVDAPVGGAVSGHASCGIRQR